MPEDLPDPPTASEASILVRHAPATVLGRYVVRAPRASAPRHHWIGFHGYAQTAEAVLDTFARSVPGEDWLVVSVQALHLFYAGRTNDVVASWMTRFEREAAIASNVGYVDTVVEQLEREFGTPGVRVFAGFSQGVGMAYRAGVLGKHHCDAIVTVGGDVPPEIAALPPRPWPAVLAMTGERDAYYSPEALAREEEVLRARGVEVSARAFDGGHEWSSAAQQTAREWLGELARRATA